MATDTFVVCTSDSHLSHSNKDGISGGILKFERGKRFANIQEHDEFIIQCWDSWMTKADKRDGEFWFLGDFGKPSEELFDKIKRVFDAHTCRKCAIFGNHDGELEQDMMNQLFDYTSKYPVYISKRVVLSHEPAPVWENTFLNVHGHTHASYLAGNSYLCASIHVANYQPITSERIASRLGKLDKYDTRFLWEPWADKYIFTKDKKDVIKYKSGRVDLSASRLLHYLNHDERSSFGKDTGNDWDTDQVRLTS